jgi:hypothetical protein
VGAWFTGGNGAGLGSAPFNVLLTSYTLFERDADENKRDRDFLKKWAWSCMVRTLRGTSLAPGLDRGMQENLVSTLRGASSGP